MKGEIEKGEKQKNKQGTGWGRESVAEHYSIYDRKKAKAQTTPGCLSAQRGSHGAARTCGLSRCPSAIAREKRWAAGFRFKKQKESKDGADRRRKKIAT